MVAKIATGEIEEELELENLTRRYGELRARRAAKPGRSP